MRRSIKGLCKPSTASTSQSKLVVPPPVVRSLYRALLKEAKILDSNPLLKTLFPLNKPLQEALQTDKSLHQPDGVSYRKVLGSSFRRKVPATSAEVTSAFDSLNRLRYHNQEVMVRLRATDKDRAQLAAALKASLPNDGTYYARVVQPPLPPPDLPQSPASAANNATEAAEGSDVRPQPHVASGAPLPSGAIRVVPKPSSNAVMKRPQVELKPGVVLIAHPLSSAHSDRRVMLITSMTHHTTTALVLDMLYSYPLSSGNPMFPELFWGHEIYNGGFLHVDFTMPPTACVAVLHTLAPPAQVPTDGDTPSSSMYHSSWLRWMRTSSNKPGGLIGSSTPDSRPLTPVEHHELLCKPLIRGSVRADGSVEPTLYYSPVEALPYLANIAAGQPRSQVRLYWGCMRWPTSQIQSEVSAGHWIPVELSPTFFTGGFPAMSAAPSKTRGGRKKSAATSEDRFSTLDELAVARELRMRYTNTEAVPPQVFPPDQPMCRRETLWDQILTSLGGEYEHLVGCSNPFASKKEGPRAPPVEIVSAEGHSDKLPLPDVIPLLMDEFDDDDDDDGDDDGSR